MDVVYVHVSEADVWMFKFMYRSSEAGEWMF